ncbi:MAG: DUF1749 domain-containing protein [Candidatus Aenigmarchaeota archaeon]|nr:DUF1749 domain-containing protein [Candidatus Aenigmarchaeota archaeon]
MNWKIKGGDLIRFCAEDGTVLFGFLMKPKRETKKVLVHIHGMVDDFYSYPFFSEFAKAALKNGFAFFSVENRGRGVVSLFEREKKNFMAGTAFERFEDCLYDIGGTLKALRKLGFKEFVLSGHSTGCQKATYYLSKRRVDDIGGLLLLGPADDRNCMKKDMGKNSAKAIGISKKMVRSGRGGEFVPKSYFESPISASRFYSILKKPSNEGDVFDYTLKKLKAFGKIRTNILVVFGSKDRYLTMSLGKMERKLKESSKNAKSFQFLTIQGSTHSFHSREKQLGKAVGKWLQKIG